MELPNIDNIYINLWLVNNGLRKVYLASNLKIEEEEVTKKRAEELKLNSFNTRYGTIYSKEKSITVKSEEELGHLLEFYCYNHPRFDDISIDRYTFNIIETNTNLIIITEVCQANILQLDDIIHYYTKKVESFNKKSDNLYHFRFEFNFEPSRNTLLNIDRYEDFDKYRDHYINIIYNMWFQESLFTNIIEETDDKNFDRNWSVLHTFIDTLILWDDLISSWSDMAENNYIGNIPDAIKLDKYLYEFMTNEG